MPRQIQSDEMQSCTACLTTFCPLATASFLLIQVTLSATRTKPSKSSYHKASASHRRLIDCPVDGDCLANTATDSAVTTAVR